MSLAKAELEVKSAVDAVLACSQISANSSIRLGDVEARLWTALLALGRAVMALFLARCGARPRPATYCHDGQRYAFDGSDRRSTEVGTRFGKLRFSRPVGIALGGASRAADLPVDRELGLCSGLSLGTVMAVTQLCAMMAFATARSVFKQSHEWMPSQRAVLRMVDALGTQARPCLEPAPAPVDDGEILVVKADGGGAPMIGSKEYQCRSKPKRKHKCTETGRHRRRTRRRSWGDRMLQNLNAACLGLAKTGPCNKGRRERLGDVIDYLTGHHSRLRYHALRRDDLPCIPATHAAPASPAGTATGF